VTQAPEEHAPPFLDLRLLCLDFSMAVIHSSAATYDNDRWTLRPVEAERRSGACVCAYLVGRLDGVGYEGSGELKHVGAVGQGLTVLLNARVLQHDDSLCRVLRMSHRSRVRLSE
jgi:hypothetical protein